MSAPVRPRLRHVVEKAASVVLCGACGRELGTVEPVDRIVPVAGDGDERYIASIRLGLRFRLAPGFVNARGRHESGAAWFVPGKPEAASPGVRLPAVATCRCGVDVTLGPNDLDDRTAVPGVDLADAPLDELSERVRRAFADEAK